MHVLSEPIQRHLSTKSLRLRRGIDLGAYGRELRAEADVVDEAGDLLSFSRPLIRPHRRSERVGKDFQSIPRVVG